MHIQPPLNEEVWDEDLIPDTEYPVRCLISPLVLSPPLLVLHKHCHSTKSLPSIHS